MAGAPRNISARKKLPFFQRWIKFGLTDGIVFSLRLEDEIIHRALRTIRVVNQQTQPL